MLITIWEFRPVFTLQFQAERCPLHPSHVSRVAHNHLKIEKNILKFLKFLKWTPLWLAPLFEPIWRPMTASPARSCSAVQFFRSPSDSFGPSPETLKINKIRIQINI